MKFDLPQRNESGEIVSTLTFTDQQVQSLLTFAVNFLVATGMAAQYGISLPNQDEDGPDEDDTLQ